MRLYKMELYKLCHRKIFAIGVVCTVAIMLIFFLMSVAEERTYVDGITYHGDEAVQTDRRITEEFKGVITDEKVDRIIKKYGLPSEVEDHCNYYVDANFLNGWVERYLSDGYFGRWNDYEPATCTFPIADTTLGEVREFSGKEIILEYNNGWPVFLEVLQMGLILGSILILFTLSVVFANEWQTKMLPLLFTTKEGRKKDIYIKIAVAFTVGVSVWLGVVALDFLLCGIVYGFSGLNCMVGLMKGYFINTYSPASMLDMGSFIIFVLLRYLLGILLLCSLTICISAYFKTSFHTAINAAICWAAPILIWILLPNRRNPIFIAIRMLIYASPLYSIMHGALYESYRMRSVYTVIDVAGFILFTATAYRKYKCRQTA